MERPKTIHLVGICGTGMGTFAGLLRAAGYAVRGSDTNVYPPMSDRLAAWGIPVMNGYAPANLEPPPDLVVIGNVIRKTNVEAEAVLARGLSYTSFPKALGDLFLRDKHSVVVAGTHGKTTTSSLLAWIFTHAGFDPSMLVGGVHGNFDAGFRLGQGPIFVVEGDEYDTAFFDKGPKFLHYHPKTLVLTSIEFDHADIYEDVDAVERAFAKVVDLVPREGTVVACASSPRVLSRASHAHAGVETYTSDERVRADWQASEIVAEPSGTSFTLSHGKIRIGRFALPLSGRHNVENATAALAVALRMDVPVVGAKDALESFRGVARRQTVRAEIDGVRIIDDFAHHPTAVKCTIEAMRSKYPQGRLFAVFEPRSATSSRKFFQEAYVEAFDDADEVVIASVGRTELGETVRLDTEKLARDLASRGKSARHVPAIDDIVALLARETQPGDTLLFMSNGAFGNIHERTREALLRKREAPRC